MRKIFYIILILLSLITTLLILAYLSLPGSQFKVWVLDVGQGDSILMENLEGQLILVDGGPDDKVM